MIGSFRLDAYLSPDAKASWIAFASSMRFWYSARSASSAAPACFFSALPRLWSAAARSVARASGVAAGFSAKNLSKR